MEDLDGWKCYTYAMGYGVGVSCSEFFLSFSSSSSASSSSSSTSMSALTASASNKILLSVIEGRLCLGMFVFGSCGTFKTLGVGR